MPSDIIPSAIDLSVDLLEPALDALLDNQILKDVPILGSAVKLAGIGRSISDRIFLAKIRRFLDALDPILDPKAHEFADDLASGNTDARRTADVLLLALDEINDLTKAPILAAVFAAFLRGKISPADFRRITAAVNSAVVDDLNTIASLGPNPSGSAKQHGEVLNALRHTGLTDTAQDVVVAGTSDLTEAVTPLGKLFIAALDSFREQSKSQQNAAPSSGTKGVL